MLDALYRVCRNTKKLDVHQVTHAAFDNTLIQREVIDLNQKQLYDEGVFADGSPTGQYAPFTLQYKTTEAPLLGYDTRTDHVTFKDKGDFYASLRFENKRDEIVVTGNTVKDGVDIQEREGKPLVGLTKDSLSETRDLVLPIFRNKTLQSILRK